MRKRKGPSAPRRYAGRGREAAPGSGGRPGMLHTPQAGEHLVDDRGVSFGVDQAGIIIEDAIGFVVGVLEGTLLQDDARMRLQGRSEVGWWMDRQVVPADGLDGHALIDKAGSRLPVAKVLRTQLGG